MTEKRKWTQQLMQEGLRAMTLGWELALPIFGGVLLGYYLDRWLGAAPNFTVGLLVGGIGAGFYNIWRFGQRYAEQERRAAELEVDEKQQ